MTVNDILERTPFILIYKTKGRFKQLRDREVTALHLEEALERAHLDRSYLVEAYMKGEFGFLPLVLEGNAIEVGVKS